jgi:hypothetical protein
MHAGIKRIGDVVRGGDELSEAGIDVGSYLETAAASFRDRVRET